jgi:hypothetical protein
MMRAHKFKKEVKAMIGRTVAGRGTSPSLSGDQQTPDLRARFLHDVRSERRSRIPTPVPMLVMSSSIASASSSKWCDQDRARIVELTVNQHTKWHRVAHEVVVVDGVDLVPTGLRRGLTRDDAKSDRSIAGWTRLPA